MTKMIQIGTMALRDPNGNFLPSRPIYRKAKRKTAKHPNVNTLDMDDIAEIFAEKYKKFLESKRKYEKEEEKKRENQTDEHLPVLRAGNQA